MAYRLNKNQGGQPEIIIDGFENGIAISPHKGIANLKSTNIKTEEGEVMCSYNRILQSQTGTGGTLTRVNTNTVSISGITLKVGQVITILVDSGTGLSGDYYYLSGANQTTGKLYAGALSPSTPDSVSAVIGINAGTATFSIKYPLGSPIQSATESYYRDLTTTLYYRYYILDDLGQVWCHDSYNLVNWDTPLWFFVGTALSGASGLAVFNGWLTVSNGVSHTYWKLTSLLGSIWIDTVGSIGFQSTTNHVMLSGHQGKLYGTDGRFITSLFPNTSLITSAANIQSYGSYTTTLGSNLVTNGTFTGSAAGWVLGAGWTYAANAVSHTSDGTSALSQTTVLTAGINLYQLIYTLSATTVGGVTPTLGGTVGTARNADGTFTEYLSSNSSTVSLFFTPIDITRFTIDNITVKKLTSTYNAIIGGTVPTTGSITPRIPAYFYSDNTLPTAISAGVLYYIEPQAGFFAVYSASTGGNALDLITGAVGNQYFNTFDPRGSSTLTFTPQKMNLPFSETATSLAEIGNTVLIGGKGNVVYPWDQSSTLPQNLLFLPENETKKIVTVNNVGYIFAGQNGNVYVTSGSSISPVFSLPDYCAGIEGTPQSYLEPYFTWGDATYCEGRVLFSILDQTSTKAGNCGGIWSFIPSQNFSLNQSVGLSLRMENQSSYGTYSGVANVLIPSLNQTANGMQYYSGWYSSITSPSYGIDFSDSIPQTAIIETDLINIGSLLEKKTFEQIEYKLSSPLVSGDSVSIKYRTNSTDAFVSLGSVVIESVTNLSGYFVCNFASIQWIQLQVTLSPLASSSSSFIRLKQLIIR